VLKDLRSLKDERASVLGSILSVLLKTQGVLISHCLLVGGCDSLGVSSASCVRETLSNENASPVPLRKTVIKKSAVAFGLRASGMSCTYLTRCRSALQCDSRTGHTSTVPFSHFRPTSGGFSSSASRPVLRHVLSKQ
jgi:hypothetical protein